MANIYLDVNVLVDLVGKNEFGYDLMSKGHKIVASCLITHILAYVMKIKIPNKEYLKLIDGMEIVNFDKNIMQMSLNGPTDDFEDNVQLHSAVAGECDYFLTMDKKLLKMKYFGRMKICNKL